MMRLNVEYTDTFILHFIVWRFVKKQIYAHVLPIICPEIWTCIFDYPMMCKKVKYKDPFLQYFVLLFEQVCLISWWCVKTKHTDTSLSYFVLTFENYLLSV